ncbi:unnamed protein product [Schistosoma curassoni]|uniref:Uncharacterized protein n=1 Tax=Schistosoma curassoni TaxID=6186 RepID=A0A183K1T9_9TREM|nr:unnamed protein product [Schistosoma curassoni]
MFTSGHQIYIYIYIYLHIYIKLSPDNLTYDETLITKKESCSKYRHFY